MPIASIVIEIILKTKRIPHKYRETYAKNLSTDHYFYELYVICDIEIRKTNGT